MNGPNFLEIKNPAEWQALLGKALFKTFFHAPQWESFLESQFKWLKFRRFVWDDKLLLSLAEIQLGAGKTKFISHPFCEYGGPLPLKTGIDFEKFKQNLFDAFKSDKIKISFHPCIFLSAAAQTSEAERGMAGRCSYFIENIRQKAEQELWLGLRKHLRQAIKKAKAAGIEVAPCEKESDLAAFYDLYCLTSKRHKNIPYPFSFFKFFQNSISSRVILAKLNGQVVAGSVFLLYGQFVHYFLNGSNRRCASLGANSAILWEQLKGLVNSNYDILDLGGTRVGSKLEVFKQGWGSVQQPIVEISNISAAISQRKSKLRMLWGLLPLSVIKILSPRLLKYKL